MYQDEGTCLPAAPMAVMTSQRRGRLVGLAAPWWPLASVEARGVPSTASPFVWIQRGAAVAAGAARTVRPYDRPFGLYSGYFQDPDRHRWETLWNPALEDV